eukprot:746156-Hanusia_phi.AAC.5
MRGRSPMIVQAEDVSPGRHESSRILSDLSENKRREQDVSQASPTSSSRRVQLRARATCSPSPSMRGVSPLRGSGVNGSNRREVYLETQNFSRMAGEKREFQALSKLNDSLTRKLRSTEEQYEACKADLRQTRASLEKMERENIDLSRRLDDNALERQRLQQKAKDSSELAEKLESKLKVVINQRGHSVMEKEAKAAETMRRLKEDNERLAEGLERLKEDKAKLLSELRCMNELITLKEEDFGLTLSGSPERNRVSVLLLVTTLRDDRDRLLKERQELELEAQEAREAREQVEAEGRRLRDVVSDLKVNNNILREEIAKERGAKETLVSEKRVMLQYIEEEMQSVEEMKQKLAAHEAENKKLMQEAKMSRQERSSTDRKVRTMDEEWRSECKESKDRIKELVAEKQELEETLAEQYQRAEHAERQVRWSEEKVEQLRKEVDHLHGDLDQLTERNSNLSSELVELQCCPTALADELRRKLEREREEEEEEEEEEDRRGKKHGHAQSNVESEAARSERGEVNERGEAG